MYEETFCKFCRKNIKVKLIDYIYPKDYFCSEEHYRKECERFNKLPEGIAKNKESREE